MAIYQPGRRVKSAAELGRFDLTKLLDAKEESFLRDIQERAIARAEKSQYISVEDRFKGFEMIGYKPHGFYLPTSADWRELIKKELDGIGAITDQDERLEKYHRFQEETGELERRGVPGHWTGQMGIARSRSPYRIVAWGRRGGKTFHAAREALAIALVRPRARVWLAAPIMRLVSRAFDMVVELVDDLGIECRGRANSNQEKYFVFRNGSRIEGISLENYLSAAGDSIDFAVIDEAAQIVPESWTRAIQPPLADRNGQALLISSYEGEGDFFHTQVVQARAEWEEIISRGEAGTTTPDWDYFQEPSWDINFYMFPQGQKSESIQRMRRNMPVREFLEQFGAIAAGARERVYPEFLERVHVGDYRYRPGYPVRLVADPSSGINPYAVIAIQDYGTHFVIIDEFYETGMTAEEIDPVLRRRPWVDDVEEMIIDSAQDDEHIRWSRMGWPAYPVPEKPRIEERIPLYRNRLRDPWLFYALYRKKVNEVLRDMGLPVDADMDLSAKDQRLIVEQVEQNLAADKMSDADLEQLKACARVFINVNCVNTITEHKTYSYQKRRRLNLNYKETPRDYMDHIMDCVGYYVWTHYRFEGTDLYSERSYINEYSLSDEDVSPLPVANPHIGAPPKPPSGFLAHCRDMYTPDDGPVVDLLV